MNRREALKHTATITGMVFSASATFGFLQGCTPTGDPGWQPQFLDSQQIKIIADIAELILPKTDTPGAIDLHVPEFIDLMLKDYISKEDQEAFIHGLIRFQEAAEEEYGYFYIESSLFERQEMLLWEESRSLNDFNNTGKMNFFLTLKELTILGYYSSEHVMKNMLNYSAVAGRFDACIPLLPEDKVYVDNNVTY